MTFLFFFAIIRKSSREMTDMRKCRNWQTSKTKDLVLIASVWVQVPSSALNGAKPNPVYFFKKVFAVVVNFTRK